jgi:DNA-directed RNA polymerase specialized sigma24 family protein
MSATDDTLSKQSDEVNAAANALAYEYLAQEWGVLRKMCQIAVRKGGKRESWEEAMSIVAERLPGILWTYDPTRGVTLRTHVIANCRWYLHKEFATKRKQKEQREIAFGCDACNAVTDDGDLREPTIIDNLYAESSVQEWSSKTKNHAPQLDDSEIVQFVLGLLPSHFAKLLELRYKDDLSFADIGLLLGVSEQMAAKYVNTAVGMVRDAVGYRQPDTAERKG